MPGQEGEKQICPLCSGPDWRYFFGDKRREYLQCAQCQLIFVPGQFHLSAAEEKQQYDLHENDVDDAAYRKFLSRLFLPMVKKLTPGAQGLEFGCGPGPALLAMFREAGFTMQAYDKFYANNPAPLQGSYDFITATEVVEHLSKPGEELDKLWSLLKPGGWLGLMTKLATDQQAFSQWHYKNDPTHICFFSKATLQWWALQKHTEAVFVAADAVLLQKPD